MEMAAILNALLRVVMDVQMISTAFQSAHLLPSSQ